MNKKDVTKITPLLKVFRQSKKNEEGQTDFIGTKKEKLFRCNLLTLSQVVAMIKAMPRHKPAAFHHILSLR